MWPLYVEYCASVLWCYCLLLTLTLWTVGHFVDLPPEYAVRSILPGFTGVIVGIVCILQLSVGLLLDSRYDHTLIKLIPWLIWYPFLYWIINAVVTIVAFPKALFKKKTALAVWESPDRGIA